MIVPSVVCCPFLFIWIRRMRCLKDLGVIVSCILHFFSRERSMEIVERAKNRTLGGGYNFIISFANKDDLVKENRFYITLDELKKIYEDWELVNETQGETPIEEHDGADPHRHNMVIITFKKK